MNTKFLPATAAVAASLAFATPAFAQDSDSGAEPFVGASIGYHDIGAGIPDDDGMIYGAVAGVDVPVSKTFFIGAEANYHFGDGAIDSEYGVAARAGVKLKGGTKLYVKGGYQEVDFDLASILGAPVPAGLDDTDGDYLVGVGADIALGESPVSLRLNADTIAFDSTRITAGVLYKF
ncbi:outer membrane protein [Parerythrobacter aestuarii]|uniref:outer membrane protein n=1 Tax=Parerythrobacter aestuarii TaxID=3020909 RepID=UPI0024DEF0C1|nr:outer membrane beta-barrel protein [Parerythrobacter aestuarii]